MLKTLTYSVTFPTNGVKLAGTLTPQPGITAIIGPNGSGKTFTSIELTRYLLFGSKALRGMASDYKTLDVEGILTIRGQDYHIIRTAKRQEIIRISDDDTLAVGAEACNQMGPELLGYGMAVFDVCNASMQKESDIFGKMPPSKRKALIDEVIGLTTYQQIEKDCRDQAKVYKLEAETLAKHLQAPVMPDKPTEYEPSRQTKSILDHARGIAKRARELRARMQEVPPKPYAPTMTLDLSSEAYDKLAAKRDARTKALALKDRLEQETSANAPKYTISYLEDARAVNEWAAKVRAFPVCPESTKNILRGDCEALLEDWAAINRINAGGETHTCPNCGTTFGCQEASPETPNYSEADLRGRIAFLNAGPFPERPDTAATTMDEKDIARYEREIVRYERVHDALQELQNLVVPDDVSEELKQWQLEQSGWVEFRRAKEQYDAAVENNAEIEADIIWSGRIMTDDELDELQDSYNDAVLYERLLDHYHEANAVYEEGVVKITTAKRLQEAFTDGAKAIAGARADVKSYLSPTFSKVASAIINEMTVGKLQSVDIDDEMNITVDGQEIGTLSGAGETVANIALRVALGQVLVKSSFPVFFADEMDAYSDDTRRAATLEAMSNLKNRLDQIILITHRSVDIADQVVLLGENVAHTEH